MDTGKMNHTIKVSETTGLITFDINREAFFDDNWWCWWNFQFRINNHPKVQYNTDTTAIYLNETDLSTRHSSEIINKYRQMLTLEGFNKIDIESIIPILNNFPIGKYRIGLETIENPFLITQKIKIRAKRAQDDLLGRDQLPDTILKSSAPNLVFPTQNMNNLNGEVVAKYKEVLKNQEKTKWPMVLFFKEPSYQEIEKRYKSRKDIIESENDLFLSNRNFYILDGHHKYQAYINSKIKPIGIIIESLWHDTFSERRKRKKLRKR